MLGSARLAFRLSGQELLEASIEALRTYPQRPYGRPAHASGKTERALRTEETDTSLTLLGPAHVQTLITGRGPTSQNPEAAEEPLHEILAQWAQDKGLVLREGQDYEELGRRLAYKIHREGTALYRERGPSLIFQSVLSPERLQRLKSRIAAGEAIAVATELRTILLS